MSHLYADDMQIYITVKSRQENIDAAVEGIEHKSGYVLKETP